MTNGGFIFSSKFWLPRNTEHKHSGGKISTRLLSRASKSPLVETSFHCSFYLIRTNLKSRLVVYLVKMNAVSVNEQIAN